MWERNLSAFATLAEIRSHRNPSLPFQCSPSASPIHHLPLLLGLLTSLYVWRSIIYYSLINKIKHGHLHFSIPTTNQLSHLQHYLAEHQQVPGTQYCWNQRIFELYSGVNKWQCPIFWRRRSIHLIKHFPDSVLVFYHSLISGCHPCPSHLLVIIAISLCPWLFALDCGLHLSSWAFHFLVFIETDLWPWVKSGCLAFHLRIILLAFFVLCFDVIVSFLLFFLSLTNVCPPLQR